MSNERTEHSVLARYHEERDYIQRFTRFLQSKATLHDEQVRSLNRILARVEVPLLPLRSYDRAGEDFSPQEFDTLVTAIRKIDPEVYQTILGHEQRLDDIPSFGLDGPAAGHLHQLHEWVDFTMSRTSDDPDEAEVESFIDHTLHEYERDFPGDADAEDYMEPDDLRALLLVALDHAHHAKVRQRVDAMVYAREQFEEIELLARVARPDAEINPLRQGFLLLATAFDAAVFDLMRLGFKKKFFQLVGIFGGNDKWSMKEMAEAGSFGAIRERIIEEQLKKRYVKDLISILAELGVKYLDVKVGDKHADLIEMIQRRNIHVHNRGVVDERYLEIDANTGKAKFNTYNLKLGDVACIDLSYMEKGYRLCDKCVFGLAQWVEKE
jgi:hypothetical protein